MGCFHMSSHHRLQMSADERKRLTWEDATQRFLDVAELSPAELANPVERGFDRAAWMLHNSLNGEHLEVGRLPVSRLARVCKRSCCRSVQIFGCTWFCRLKPFT